MTIPPHLVEIARAADILAVARRYAARKQARLDPARARRLAEQIHALGPRSLYHLIIDLADGHDLRETLEHYASLPAGSAVAWRDLPSPVHVVDDGEPPQ